MTEQAHTNVSKDDCHDFLYYFAQVNVCYRITTQQVKKLTRHETCLVEKKKRVSGTAQPNATHIWTLKAHLYVIQFLNVNEIFHFH